MEEVAAGLHDKKKSCSKKKVSIEEQGSCFRNFKHERLRSEKWNKINY